MQGQAGEWRDGGERLSLVGGGLSCPWARHGGVGRYHIGCHDRGRHCGHAGGCCGHAGGHFDCGAHCLVVMWHCHIGVADVSGCGVGREQLLTVIGSCRWQWAAVGGSRQCWVWVVVLSQGVSSCGMVAVEGQDAQTSTQTTSTHIQRTEHAERCNYI